MKKLRQTFFALLGGVILVSCTNGQDTEIKTPEVATEVTSSTSNARFVTIQLTYRDDVLWWSTDGISWGEVGPNSPQTILAPGDQINWVFDDTMDDLGVEFVQADFVSDVTTDANNGVMTGLISASENGSKTKYDLLVTPAGSEDIVRIDPEVKACDPPCPPGVGG